VSALVGPPSPITLPRLPVAADDSPVAGTYDLASRELFSNDAIATLLDDRYGLMRVHTAGPLPSDWADCDRSRLDGSQLLAAVLGQNLWINVIDVGRRSPELAALIASFEATLARLAPIDELRANLLISSPGACVQFHVDPEPNLLVQIRGRKRVRVYPARDSRFCRPDQVAAICSGTVEEELPFSTDFDEFARTFDLAPGDVLAWPQHAPHRVENLEGVNVTLSVSWYTPQIRRRMYAYASHHHLRRTPLGHWLDQTSRLEPARVFAFRAARRLGLLPHKPAAERPPAQVLEP